MTDHSSSSTPVPATDLSGSLAESQRAVAAVADEAVEVARRWERATAEGATRSERATSEQLGGLLRDEAGLGLAVRFVDEVARPEDPYVAAKVLSTLTTGDAGSFLGPVDRSLLGLGSKVAPLAPPVVVPVARRRLRQIVGHLVADAKDPGLRRHLARARAEGFRLNVNLLGEAVLGEEEAASRTTRTRELLARDDVDYVSIKVSSLVSQISTWDTEGTVERVLERLRPLYRTAAAKAPKAFVNLDMEEYKDLDLTMEVFERMLREEEFHDLEAGIVLQAYLPDALPALERMIAFGRERRDAGHAGIKIRVVKGANLAMERAEAELHGWEQAPYATKEDVDSSYLAFVERALRPDATEVLRLGVASHNLFDTATAYLLARQRGCLDRLDVEMLQGMAPSQARAVKEDVGSVLLYTPVVAPEDFDVAVSYLIRRLEENAQPQNFLHAMFSADPRAGAKGRGASGPDSADHDAMADQERRYRESVEAMSLVPVGPRRSFERATIGERFTNTADSDPALPAARAWARAALDAKPAPLASPVLHDPGDVDRAVACAVEAAPTWAGRPAHDRAQVLRQAARELEARRGELLTVMAAEGGKTVGEADPEVSEAIDFARYYADRALELEDGASAHTDGARFRPDRVVLVTPPWNFPVAIPIGGVLAALAAGSAVIIKPAHPTPGCVEVAAEALWAAGVPREVLQVVRTDEREAGRALVSHHDVDTVVLTGASETAHMFAGWRALHEAGPRVYGETSGKNALVVTPAADLDLAAADLVRSAFGHAGQKCSAASLAILVGSVGTSERFRRQLVDAVRSLRVGWPQDLGTTMGPIIEEPSDKLLRALTTLEPGETWLVEPRRLDDSGRLWSPGLKDGVRPGSFFHLTEVFGPVLGLMRADSLQEAVELQNATAFGLTGGLHSLDTDEIDWWLDHVDVGNAYINRHITGAIVQRQSFGGWKDSVVGPGAKAGGPNYVALLGSWSESGLPRLGCEPAPRVREQVRRLLPLLGSPVGAPAAPLSTAGGAPVVGEREWLEAALRSDAHAWRTELGVERDESGLSVEANVFRYRPQPEVWVRLEEGARPVELVRLLAAAALAGCPVQVSVDPTCGDLVGDLASGAGDERQALEDLRPLLRVEERDVFTIRVRDAGSVRVRVVGAPQPLVRELGDSHAILLTGPVLANGRRELLTFLREQAISRTLHRYGHVAPELAR